ncbi:MAG TPA: AAA family ATPase [Candidatus Thiothrix moscowensis]|uniref:AAA family ATPase n=1 Tax=unclassified Thiothrix TaxID=2636184 RepID=UPI0025E8945B|nr:MULTISPECIES: AAA family ATPase [unclassified Thiothrix]HRJ51396.1 AAA family ATPase [Candidatus Thiothrix moscowensis]HRJ91549.1 AAA family ATPase [Candidatus Thiothrix moscowensis]
MKIPYGISNFKTLITGGYVYIDKTDYIARLEDAGNYQILLRPRRFGKSLFLSTLEHYYDIAHQSDFDALFATLYIGKHPTPLKNSYPVLFMEFSGIATETPEDVYRAFNTKVELALQRYLGRYQYPVTDIAAIAQRASPYEKMEAFFSIVEGQKILLLIDEYDHFANALLSQDFDVFQSIVGKGGFVRSFYETIKTATQRGTVDRLFITGVTPLMLDSMTSGFNIGENLSLHEDFNSVAGFTEAEVASLLQPLVQTCQLDADALMADVRRWYNGYRFCAQAQETVYNANMLLYFLKNFRFQNCSYPKQMLDENIASDYGKIMGMFSIGDRDTNFAVLDEIINIGEVSANQRRKFDFDKGFDRDDFISLLAYMGFVSLRAETLSGEVFSIPNHAIHELYFHYFKVELERRNQISIPNRALMLAVESLALHDDIQPLADEMQRVLQMLSNRDFMQMDEKHIKTLLLTLLYQSSVYFIQSEREMNHKYPDILLLERSPFAVKHQHLIELKYAKKGDGEKGWEAKREEGIAQVQGYLQLAEIAALPKLSAWMLLTDSERVTVMKMQ